MSDWARVTMAGQWNNSRSLFHGISLGGIISGLEEDRAYLQP